MRCMTLTWCLMLASAVLCSGVGAAVLNHRATHAVATHAVTLHGDVSSLPPADVFPLAAGRVVAVDSKDGEITVAHAPIPRFYLERMTRIFPVEDPATLAGLTPGDKIRFDLRRRTGRYVITRIENSN
ncbi:copper-binding protein [Reyranella sp.]|uniref:copper-binding protein n=1 Tax=Reyranella sp. TaxID=1929291 RepID=UPI002F95E6A3